MFGKNYNLGTVTPGLPNGIPEAIRIATSDDFSDEDMIREHRLAARNKNSRQGCLSAEFHYLIMLYYDVNGTFCC